jgi:hypothetical protein
MSSPFKKDPDAVLDYTFNWGSWLTDAEDVIDTVEWIPDEGLTVANSTYTSTTATAFVSGGAVGDTLKLTCRITTLGGRTDDRTITLKIVDR